MKANEILRILEEFSVSPHKRIILNGKWGIGKTKYLSDFFSENINRTSYVSLYGLSNVEEVINTLNYELVKGKSKKTINALTKGFKTILKAIKISGFGVSFSFPFTDNALKASIKKLKKNESHIICFDDLERKNEKLQLDELFGLIDKLTSIEHVKIVLVSDLEALKDIETYKKYKEKSIDREYLIDSYSLDAPSNILTSSDWIYIEDIIVNEQQNLRIFEKLNNYKLEVLNHIPNKMFTEKFTQKDLITILYAVVYFVDVLLSVPKLPEDTNDYEKMYYEDEVVGHSNYILNNIIKKRLDNDLSGNLINHFLVWYRVGLYDFSVLLDEINWINTYKEPLHNFYSSEEDIRKIIEAAEKSILNYKHFDNLEDLIKNIDIALTWCGIFEEDFSLSNKEIIEIIEPMILDKIDYNLSLLEIRLDAWSFGLQGKITSELLEEINDFISNKYYVKFIDTLRISSENNDYTDHKLIKNLHEEVQRESISDENINIIRQFIRENDYCFPIPSGTINELIWSWCRNISKLIKVIDDGELRQDFINWIEQKKINLNDKVLNNRIKQLLK